MSRLAPLITRNPGPVRAVAMAVPVRQAMLVSEAQAGEWLADLRLFVTVWLGGVVFFGTMLS
jgi:hypothetical protein